MAADFAQERKWRVKSARVLATSLATFHKNQETRVARQLKVGSASDGGAQFVATV